MARFTFVRSVIPLSIALILGASNSLLFAMENVPSSSMAHLAAKLPQSGEIYLGLFNQEQPDGFMRLGWHHDGSDLLIYDRTMMPSMEIFETMEAAVSAKDFTPDSVSIRFHRGSAIMQIDTRLESSEVKGERQVRRPGEPADVNPVELGVPDAVMLRAVTFLLPLVMNQEPGTSLAYDWYAPMGNAVQSVTLTARDGGAVETPAGSFDTVRYELRGGSPENDIYVSRGPDPRIVRIDVLGQPLQFLALAAAK